MKKIILCSLIAVATVFAFVSCKKEPVKEVSGQDGIDVTIIAGNPLTKTMLGADGTTPYWRDGDALSVTDGANSNVQFTENSIAAGAVATIATFSGKVSATGDFYAVYPHTGSVTDNKGPRVTVPSEQHPTATSFDGAADIMVSKKFAVGVTTNTTVENLQFARCGAILKVVFSGKNAAQQTQLANQHPVSVSLTSSDNDLVGNVLFDYENATASISSSPSKTVAASYTNSTHYAIDGTNATYLVVVPTTLTGTISVAATTEDYEIARTLTMPTEGIALEAGKLYTFNVTLGANSISEATPAQTLPWSHDFSWHNSTTETNYSTDIATKSGNEFTGATLAYGAKESGAIRIGNGSNPGNITSKLLNLSGAFTVIVKAKAYNTSDKAKIFVTVDDVTKTATTALTSDYVDYEFEFAADEGSSKSSIVIGTTQKRAVITSVSVESLVPDERTEVTLSFNPASPDAIELGDSFIEPTLTVDPAAAASSVTYAVVSEPANAATIDSSTGELTISAAGIITVTASIPANNETYKPASASYTLTVNVPVHGSVNSPVSLEEVIDVIDELDAGATTTDFYYVGGTVTVASNGLYSGKLTFTFGDETNAIKAYNCLGIDGAPFAAKTDVKVGDQVVVYGNLEKYVKNNETTYEVVNCQLAALTPAPATVTGISVEDYTPIFTASETGVYSFDGKVYAIYSDETKSELSASDYSITGTVDLTTAGAYPLTVSATVDGTLYSKDIEITVNSTGSGSEVNASLTESEIKANVTITACAYGTEKTYADANDGIEWVASCYADAGRPWMQLKSAADSYIKITANGSISQVDITMTSASNSSGGVADITKHTGFKGTVSLSSAASSGTTYASHTESTNATTTKFTLTPNASVSEVYLKVSAGARIWGIDVTYTTDN